MSTFAVLLLCAQACFVQLVYGQCLRGAYGPIAPACGWEGGLVAPALGWDGLMGPGYGWDGLIGLAGPAFGWDGLAGPYGWGPAGAIAAYPTLAAYGGEGIGDVAVAGEMGVGGVTEVVGKVPVLGAVEFGGIVPAAGTITITGSCGCGCNGAFYY